MKKLFLLLLLFISVKAFAQYPAPTGTSSTGAMQFFFKKVSLDTLFYGKDSKGNWYPFGRTSGSGGAWGSITGTLSAQTDLMTALNAKQPLVFTTQALLDSSHNGASTAYVDRAVYNNSSFFVPNLFVGDGSHGNPFSVAPNAIKFYMLSASGPRNATTFLAGDSTFRTISTGGDSTIYKKDGTISDAVRTVTLGANQLNFIAKSGSDSTGVVIDNTQFDVTTKDGVSSSELASIANSAGIFTTETSTGNSANISTQNNAGLTHFNVQVVDNGTHTNTGIDIGVGTGSSPGVVVSDGRSHVGHVGDELFPLYSGKQYAQVHMVDSIAKAKADSVKGTISAGGVTTFNTRSGAVTLNSTDVSTALGFTPVTNARTLTINGTAFDLSTDRSWTIATGLATTNFVYSETPSGTVNGSNTTFTIANTPTSGTLRVYENGLRLKATTDYSLSGTTITFVGAPLTGDILQVDYLK